MAKSDSRYIQFYTSGSAACKVELQQEQAWAPLPKFRPEKRIEIAVDPVAMIGFVVAVAMLIFMAVGIQQLNYTRQEVAVLEQYAAQLTAEKNELSQQYVQGYDLEEIRIKATDMGMIPVEEATHIQLSAIAQ